MIRSASRALPATAASIIMALGVAVAVWSVEPCPEPQLRAGLPGDATDDAAGRGQMFESIAVPGFTDQYVETSGTAIADVDRDGRLDIVVIHSGYRGNAHSLHLLLNRGCFRFEDHPVQISGSQLTAAELGPGVQVPNLVDFNNDGYLDILLTRSGLDSQGNTLLVSDGAFDRFVDLSTRLDLRNLTAYSRQSTIADVNGDGWLDVGIASDNIGDTRLGRPIQRLYVFRPEGDRFEAGSFEDIGGTKVVPGFGGTFAGDPRIDKASPQLVLRDLDNDSDVDLVQSYATDMLFGDPEDPNASGMYDQGVWAWRNLLRETGEFRFERIVDNGLAQFAKMHYNAWKKDYDVVVHGPGLPYMSVADVDNDGLLDAVATGATDPFWHVQSDQVSGAFWTNLGGFRFREATREAGLDPLSWTYGQWRDFWGVASMPSISLSQIRFPTRRMPSRMEGMTNLDLQPYGGDLVFGDFDNDGWQDLLWVDRHEFPGFWGVLRNVLFMNNGDGTFRPVNADVSGIDDNCASADLNGDGLLDIVYVCTPGNTAPGMTVPEDRFADKVYWNTGAHGGRENHWLRLRFSGISDHRLVAAHVLAYEAGTLASASPKLVGMRTVHSNQSYRTGVALESHFGLGERQAVDLEVKLLDGRVVRFPSLGTDRVVDLNLEDGSATPVEVPAGR